MRSKEIAQWLYEKILAEGSVYQAKVVHEIVERFGKEYTYVNNNGNLAVGRAVLREFEKLKDGKIEWNGKDKYWCLNDGNDLWRLQNSEQDLLIDDDGTELLKAQEADLEKLMSSQAQDIEELLKGQAHDLEGLL